MDIEEAIRKVNELKQKMRDKPNIKVREDWTDNLRIYRSNRNSITRIR